jgi:hypothetical protein
MLQRQLYDLPAERDRQLICWLQEHLPLAPTRRPQVVELGYGDGTLSRALSAEVLGVDLAPAHIERARPRAGDLSSIECTVLNLDGELAPLESKSADVWRTKWGWDDGHLRYFTLQSLRDLLLGAGLFPLVFRESGARLARWRRFAPALLAGNLAVLARQ